MSDWRSYEEVYGPDNTVAGTVLVWRQLRSPELGGARDILVYLPPSLAARGEGPHRRRYPVLYFHDGQNVFDERTSHVGEWHADEALEQLATEGLEAIAVAIPNSSEARMSEYSPWYDSRRGTSGKGEAYLAYVVETVKPLIDLSFPTQRDRMATGIVGSSLGGLISLYALLARGDVFGLAGVMSPALGWGGYRILSLVEERGLPPSRIHLDMGGREWQGMMADARRLRDLLIARGFVEGRDLHYVEERYAPHQESAWSRRLPDALRFLLAEAG